MTNHLKLFMVEKRKNEKVKNIYGIYKTSLDIYYMHYGCSRGEKKKEQKTYLK